MKKPMHSRRVFLKVLFAAGGIAAMSGWFFRSTPLRKGAERLLAESVLGGFFVRPESALKIGRRYLEIFPGEKEEARLVRSFLKGAGLTPGELFYLGREDLRRRISAAVKRDFETGRTVRLDGWVLSATEARLCAVTALR